ncbi:MAG: hypothetical protein ACK4P8_06135 [Tabrizicola sp.]
MTDRKIAPDFLVFREFLGQCRRHLQRDGEGRLCALLVTHGDQHIADTFLREADVAAIGGVGRVHRQK